MLMKSPSTRDNVSLSTLDAKLAVSGLPKSVKLVTATMPPIATGPVARPGRRAGCAHLHRGR